MSFTYPELERKLTKKPADNESVCQRDVKKNKNKFEENKIAYTKLASTGCV